ncbi:MAG: EAL domain-containing protein [Clostridiales bacterium]|nr:EAL domain-containing protein [Clostridiales bacterium]
MRQAFAALFIALVFALAACVLAARRSYRPIGKAVALLSFALIPPVIGNLLLVLSGNQTIALIGCYTYFIGMDFVMVALLRFTFEYCNMQWKSPQLRLAVYAVLTLDVVQLLLNPFTGHAFDTEAVVLEGLNYYRLVPHIGQTFHRVVDYGIFFTILLIFFIKIIRSPRIYMERYSVILFSMIVTGAWQTYYIFSRTPIDRSMAGYGVFGLLIFYFSLYYRPMTLLDRMLAKMASDNSEALYFFDAEGRCIWANGHGIELVDIKGQKFDQAADLLNGKFGFREYTDKEWTHDQILGSGEEAKYYHFDKKSITDEKNRFTGSFLSIRDCTAEQLALAREMYAARHDDLTDLYTKAYLYECIEKELQKHPDRQYLVIYLDVMDFKIVNDVFSTAYGDTALIRLSDWIRKNLSKESVYGRLGGDTFGIFIPKKNFDKEKIEKELSHFSVKEGNVDYSLMIHLGVYEVGEKDKEVSVMFDRAHLALTTIQSEYQVHVAFYDEKTRKDVLWSNRLSAQLNDALKNRELQPYYQPIVDVNGKVVGAEALVRWIHPTEGFLSPAVFIPVFEKNGAIVEVDRYMWRSACEMIREWGDRFGDIFVSVNISPKDFYFMDVSYELQNLVKEYGIDPSRLRIEITETVMMTDLEKRMKILSDLRQAGFIVEMDDFGSGFSSLSLLKDMPVDVLKIDMKFLNKASDDHKAKTILQNIINMSEDLGIFSLTEGVETNVQHNMLAEMGCRLFQGFYFARPMPREAFERFLDEGDKLIVTE